MPEHLRDEVEIITPEEVCKLLNVPMSWIYEKSRSRQPHPFPVHRIGKYLRFRRSEVLRWFDAQLNGEMGRNRGRRRKTVQRAEVARG